MIFIYLIALKHILYLYNSILDISIKLEKLIIKLNMIEEFFLFYFFYSKTLSISFLCDYKSHS